MFLKYMNKGIQLVRTKEGKKEVQQGDIFEAFDRDGKSRLRNYKGMFEVIENKEEEKKEEKNENKGIKKWKKTKK